MNQIKAYTITFCCLVLICFLSIIYLFWYAEKSQVSKDSMLASKATNGTTVEEFDLLLEHTKLGFAQPTLFVNYSLLPDIEGTEATKIFFESILVNGIVGRNSSFQDGIDKLSIAQILSNMLLKPNVQEHLQTVGLTTNMLSMEQIKACYVLSHALLIDLGKISKHAPFSDEQTAVLNTAVGRLAFLHKNFKQELAKYGGFDAGKLHASKLSVSEILREDKSFQLVSGNDFDHYMQQKEKVSKDLYRADQ